MTSCNPEMQVDQNVEGNVNQSPEMTPEEIVSLHEHKVQVRRGRVWQPQTERQQRPRGVAFLSPQQADLFQAARRNVWVEDGGTDRISVAAGDCE